MWNGTRSVLELYPLRPDDAAETSTRLGFTVPDLALTLERLKGANAVVTSDARTTVWGKRAVVRDPDGRSVELCEQ